jgi:hypothetical protein
VGTGDALLWGRNRHQYICDDLDQHAHILDEGQYHAVVGNPPYITVKDKALNEAYRKIHPTCAGKYALSVPFAEKFFQLARYGDGTQSAGYVGQITSNSFMKREFGKKLIEQFFSEIDLTHVIDTSGAYIPDCGTPTVILFGRHRHPSTETVRAVLGIRGEPSTPSDPSRGLVWTSIIDNIGHPGTSTEYVTIAGVPRATLATHPWSLSGGGATELAETLESAATGRLGSIASEIGIVAVIGEEDAFELRRGSIEPAVPLVVGEHIRDYRLEASPCFWPYDPTFSRNSGCQASVFHRGDDTPGVI